MGLSGGLIQAIAELKAVEESERAKMVAAISAISSTSILELSRELQDWTSPRLFVDKTPPYSSDIRVL